MKLSLVLAGVTASLSTLAVAQTERDLESHEHGSATLNVAIADSSLFIEFNTPWNNLVGFEHSPETQEEHNLVDEVLSQLNEPDRILSINGGNCTLDETLLDNAMEDEDHGDGHDDEHKDEHDDEHKDEHDDDDHAQEGEAQTHTSLLVNYSYQCKDISQLNSIDFKLFSLWQGFDDVDVQLVGPTGQALEELNPEKTVLNLEQVL